MSSKIDKYVRNVSKKKKTLFQVRVDDELLEKVKQLRIEHNVTWVELINGLFKLYVREMNKK